MTQHDQMRHLQNRNRIFDRGTGAVVVAIGCIGRHQIRDIAMNKELTLVRAKDRGDVNAAVAAGNHHRARALPFGSQTPVPALVFLISRRFPAVVTRHEIARQRLGVLHMVHSLI